MLVQIREKLNTFIPQNKKLRAEFYDAIGIENLYRLLIVSACYLLFEIRVMFSVEGVRNGILSTMPLNLFTLNVIMIVFSVFMIIKKPKASGGIVHMMVSAYSLILMAWSIDVSSHQIFETGSITMFILTMMVTSALFYRRGLFSITTNLGAYAYFVSFLYNYRPNPRMGQFARLHEPMNYITDSGLILVICCFLSVLIVRLRLKVFVENKALKELALKDSMTNLMNHRTIMDSLKNEINQCKRYERPLSVLMVDIDHFKSINDTYGHQFGDVVIKQIAAILKQKCRESDYVGRYGGEEFLIVLTCTTGDEASVLAERVREAIEQTDFGIAKRITISGGIKDLQGENAEEMIRYADQALYKAKAEGRNRIVKVS